MMLNPLELIDKYYASNPPLRSLLVTHSRMVKNKALEIISRHGLEVDKDFVAEAAMLHDIGIIHCKAPGILCEGDLPYICHGIEGRQILENEGLTKHALVCERHTGSGLTVNDITAQNLPLPLREMLPISLEEKLICYADKFFSKSDNPTEEIPLDRVIQSMQRHGEDTLDRFLQLHKMFG